MSKIYVLQLQDNKYYVGKTNDVDARFAEHLSVEGSGWTSKYPPISVIEIRESKSPLDEDTVTREYMMKFGIDNVRGATYVTEQLSEEQKNQLNQVLFGALNRCHGCGSASHWIRDCDQKQKQQQPRPQRQSLPPSQPQPACFRCGHTSHLARDCFARTSVRGDSLDNKDGSGCCFRCGRNSHYARDCFARTAVSRVYLGDGDSDSD